MVAGDELRIILWMIFVLALILALLGLWRMIWLADTQDRVLGGFTAFVFAIAILICTMYALNLTGE